MAHFIEWCGKREIGVDTSMRLYSEDSYGNLMKRRTLTKPYFSSIFFKLFAVDIHTTQFI